MNDPLDDLDAGDRLRVELSDGTTLTVRLQNDPDTGPPTTPDGEAAGWDLKTLLGGVAVEEDDGTGYETLLLTQEQRGGEWGEVEGVGYVYDDERLDYKQDDLSVAAVRPVE